MKPRRLTAKQQYRIYREYPEKGVRLAREMGIPESTLTNCVWWMRHRKGIKILSPWEYKRMRRDNDGV